MKIYFIVSFYLAFLRSFFTESDIDSLKIGDDPSFAIRSGMLCDIKLKQGKEEEALDAIFCFPHCGVFL